MTEPRRTWLFIPLAAAALLTAGHQWGRSSVAAAGPQTAVARSEERTASARPTALRTRPARSQLPPPVPGPTDASPGADAESLGPAEVVDELEPEDEEILAEEARVEHFDELNRRIDGEVVDGPWRHRTEAPLQRLLAEHLNRKIGIADVTCASSFCRVKLTHPEFSRLPEAGISEFDRARASLEVTDVQYDNRWEGATTLYFKRGPAPAERPALAEAD